MRWTGVAVAALTVALAAAGCDCPQRHWIVHGFVPMASFRAAISTCLAGGDCVALCAGAFGLDADTRVEHCHVDALVRPDATTLPAPIEPATDVGSMSGANVTVGYVHTAGCDLGGAAGIVYDEGGGWEDPGCEGACDGVPGDEMDDGGDDGGGDDGGGDDGGGDDGGGDDGGGDDGGGDDGGGDDGGDGGDGWRPPPAIAHPHRTTLLSTLPDPAPR